MPRFHIEFDPDDGSAIMPIYRPARVEELKRQAELNGFKEKSEFHVTILQPTDFTPDESNRVKAVLGSPITDLIVSEHAIYRVVKSKIVEGTWFERESIVARVYSDDLRRVLGRIPLVIGYSVPTPFLHVTLFTKGDNLYAPRGIGIADVAEFSQVEHHNYPPRP